jgi:hypothetical protein
LTGEALGIVLVKAGTVVLPRRGCDLGIGQIAAPAHVVKCSIPLVALNGLAVQRLGTRVCRPSR